MMTRSSYRVAERNWLRRLLKYLDEAPTITFWAQVRRAAGDTITPEDTLRNPPRSATIARRSISGA
jgi:hypothetical protein